MAAFRALCLAMMLLPMTAAVARQRATTSAAPPRQPTITVGEATLDDTLEIAGDSVAGEQVETRMAVDVAIDDRGPYRFVVDSGADRTVIGERLAAALRLPAGQPVTLHGMAGSSRRETALIARLAVGGSVVQDVAAPLLPERYLGARGLLGIDALRGQRLMLDFERQAITIEDTRRPVRASADEIVVTARQRGGQLILTQARAAGVRIRAVVDTGSQLTIGNLALRDALFRRRKPPPMTPATLVSVTGETMVVPLAIVPELRIGGIVMSNVPVAFADLPPFVLFGLHDMPAMMLGTDLMGSFRRVSLDFGAKKVRFQLRRCRGLALVVGSRPFRLRDDAQGGNCPA
ncbi:putative aspartyl protease [Sphingomonas insulae]|uniref:Retropepsin-like aspartic protease n=1 Tax=Sphingomonas insulae TaxID=424800 RepID=A0ABN1HVP4_9SPHN|nr:retroviral-like aspartic protease family protein [Sphingomonas insulae]NIJ28577.1 putative aspartyl protease [Sphingomonas insulae]